MPCRGDGYPTAYDMLKTEFDTVTDYLCLVCKLLEQNHPAVSKPDLLRAVSGLSVWWSNHKEMDRARLERERKQKETEDTRKRALGKLSPDEKKALGLK